MLVKRVKEKKLKVVKLIFNRSMYELVKARIDLTNLDFDLFFQVNKRRKGFQRFALINRMFQILLSSVHFQA